MNASVKTLTKAKRLSTLSILIVLLILAGAMRAQATTLFSQPHDGSSTLYQSSTWDPNGSDYDQWVWDRFSLSSSQAITAVNWRGGGGGGAPIVNFEVAIYASLAGGSQPDLGYLYTGPLVSYVVNGNAGETFVGTFGGIPFYDYHFALPSPFQATAGEYYWIYIVASQSGMPGWGLANGGSGTHFRCISAAGDRFYQIVSGDAAFSLEGSDLPTVMISASAAPSGWGTVQGAGAYPIGSLVSMLAIPGAGHGFVNWTEGNTIVSTSANYSFTAAVDRTLVAHFTQAYTITTSSLPQAGGSTSGGGIYNQGASVTVSAVPASGYNFTAWLEGGSPVSTSANYTFTINANRNLVAQFTATQASALFDFDTGTPPCWPGESMPGSQTNAGLTAYFTALNFGFWSIQNNFYYWVPSNFSGNFLYPSYPQGRIEISFSQPLTSLGIQFFTGEVSSEYDVASLVRITAYSGSINSPPIGNISARGDWISGAYPQGSVTFNSATPFDIVTLDIPSGQGYPVSGYLFVDNVVAQRAPTPNFTITAAAAPLGGGLVTGAGTYESGSPVTLEAVANAGYSFVNWTEAGIEVCADAVYNFTADANRSLTANFVPLVGIATSGITSDGAAYGDGAYLFGQAVELRAVPRTDRAFRRWDENGAPVCSTATYRFTATVARLLVAVFEPDTLSATFDFDTGLPALADGDPLPASQLSGGWSATFIASSGDFSVQSDASLTWNLTRLSGHYLLPIASPSGLDVVFDRPVSSVSLSFATMDFQPFVTPSEARLTAWSDVNGTQWVGEATATGVVKIGDALPTGTLALQADGILRIRLDMPAQPSGVTDLAIDNISVRATPRLIISYSRQSDPTVVMLNWLAPTSGYVLQTASDPSAAVWQSVPVPVQLIGNEYRVMVPLSADRNFYRLFHP